MRGWEGSQTAEGKNLDKMGTRNGFPHRVVGGGGQERVRNVFRIICDVFVQNEKIYVY